MVAVEVSTHFNLEECTSSTTGLVVINATRMDFYKNLIEWSTLIHMQVRRGQ